MNLEQQEREQMMLPLTYGERVGYPSTMGGGAERVMAGCDVESSWWSDPSIFYRTAGCVNRLSGGVGFLSPIIIRTVYPKLFLSSNVFSEKLFHSSNI
jgi:hypothetical protein